MQGEGWVAEKGAETEATGNEETEEGKGSGGSSEAEESFLTFTHTYTTPSPRLAYLSKQSDTKKFNNIFDSQVGHHLKNVLSHTQTMSRKSENDENLQNYLLIL